MKVSLCGPHSFDTSTLPFAVVELVVSGLASPPLSRMNSYLLHQVGSFELFCAIALGGRCQTRRLSPTKVKTEMIAKRLFVIDGPSLLTVNVLPGRLIFLEGKNSFPEDTTAKAGSCPVANHCRCFSCPMSVRNSRLENVRIV